MQSLLDWLITLRPGTLYAVLSLTAAIENVFPPFPSDVVVAFGSFVAAQGSATAVGVFVATWLGNILGAMLVYAVGRRYGAERLERRLGGRNSERTNARLRALFERYGMPAIFLSRFVPGVRAVVPAFAGALRLNVAWTSIMIASASAIWYGLITFAAYQVGADWDQLKGTIAEYSRAASLIGAAIILLALIVWLIARRRRKAD